VLAPKEPGINEQSILYTTEVGAFADTNASDVTAPGIINGGGCLGVDRTVSLSTRHEGTIVAFVDGHAKYFPGKRLNERDAADPLTRAFVNAQALGIITNYGGGYEERPATVTARGDMTIGGEYCGRPLIGAIGELYKAAEGGKITDRGFRGGMYPMGRLAKPAQYLWATTLPGNRDTRFQNADLTAPADTPTLAYQAIARDAVVVIVAKNAKLKLSGYTAQQSGARGWVTEAALRAAYAAGAANGRFQGYGYDKYNETRIFFAGKLGIGTVGKAVLTVGTDGEMVEKVALDPYGLGYCSLAMADPNRVDIVALGADAATAVYLPNPHPTAAPRDWWELRVDPPAGYALTRTIYLKCVGAQAVRFKADYNAGGISYKSVLAGGPLFKASYWLP
jgi:hypothetical protein